MRAARARVLVFILAFFVVPAALYAQTTLTIRVLQRWRLTLRATDLTGGAGTGFPSAFESAADEVSITISKTAEPPATWQVDIRRTDTNWDTGVRLYARRTTGGTGTGSITGGTVYQEVSDVDQYFFSGSGDRSKIEIQYKVEGVSVALGQDTCVTEISYTVTQ